MFLFHAVFFSRNKICKQVCFYRLKLIIWGGLANTQFVVDPVFYCFSKAEMIILEKDFHLYMIRLLLFIVLFMAPLLHATGQTTAVDSMRQLLDKGISLKW